MGDEKLIEQQQDQMKKLTLEQLDQISQIEATLAIENMPLTEQARKNLIDVASGKKTTDQMAEEIKRRYKNV